MTCPHCCGAGRVFGERMARKELKRFVKKGPRATTSLLVEGLTENGHAAGTLLDIGGGIGAVAFEHFDRGVDSATSVDAAPAFIRMAQEEAEARGIASRLAFRVGDFVDEAASIAGADLVSLDRVICCYPHVELLLELAGERAGRRLALVAPRELWWIRPLLRLSNLYFRATRNAFRLFVHPWRLVDQALGKAGLEVESVTNMGMWCVAIYQRPS